MKNNINMNIDCSIAPWHDATKLSIKSFLSVIFGFTSAKQNGSAHSALPSVCTKIVPYPLLIVLCLFFSVGYASAFSVIITGNGSECDPYQISTVAQLKELADSVSDGVSSYSGKYFKLMNDIGSAGNPVTNPIGITQSYYFSGNFDGDGHYVYLNIVAGPSSAYSRGLFGCVINGANIHDVITKGSVSVVGSGNYGYAGGIAGYCGKNVTIYNCTNEASVSTAWDFAGGIVGDCYVSNSNETITISNCINKGTISNSCSNTYGAGGIVGTINGVYSSGVVIIDRCYNAGSISSGRSSGGIVSELFHATISNCYNSGPVSTSGTSEYYYGAGGIVGRMQDYAYVYNCYNVANVTGGGMSNKNCAGGICGTNYSQGMIKNCYNGGNVSNAPTDYLGGAVGFNYNNNGNSSGYYCIVENCYSKGSTVICGKNGEYTAGTITNCAQFTHSSYNNNKLSLAVSVNSTNYPATTTDVLIVLRDWVTAQNTALGTNKYLTWDNATSNGDNADSQGNNGGMPKFFACIPITISNFDVTTSSGQNALEWTASPSGVASSYTIYWGTPTIYWSCSSNIISPVSGNSYSHTGLTAGNTYCYEVMAVGSGDYCAENAHSTRICRTVPTCIPPAVENFSVTQPDAKGRKLQVSWTPETNITYKLYYGVNNPALGLGGLYEVPGTVTPAYTVERLTNGQPYFFVLKPIGGNYCDGTVVYPSTVTPQCNE